MYRQMLQYKRASELNNRAQCKNAINFLVCSVHMYKKGLTARAPKQKSLQMGLDNISEETCVVPGSV